MGLLLPWFEAFVGRQLQLSAGSLAVVACALLGVEVLVGSAAGAYPVLSHSSQTLASSLRRDTRMASGKSRSRSTLVTLHFAVSIGLLLVAAGTWRQMHYVATRDLGFDKEHIVVLPLSGGASSFLFTGGNTRYLQDLLQSPAIEAVSACSRVPGRWEGLWAHSSPFSPADAPSEQSVSLQEIFVDARFIDVLGIDLVAGRNFADGEGVSERLPYIVTESAARALGWDDAVGKLLRSGTATQGVVGEVVGVIHDFHGQSLDRPAEPLVLRPNI